MKKTIKIIVLLFTCIFLMNIKVESNAQIEGNDVVELRGVWVSTVSNIDVKKQNGTNDASIKAYKEQLINIFDRVKSVGLNAIFFQVRPSNDAFYESIYNPYSEFLAGYGVNPNFNVLEFITEECHKRGLEVHAWLNPYRATASEVISKNMTQEEKDKVKLSLKNKMTEADPDTLNPVVTLPVDEYLTTIVTGAKEYKLYLNPSREVTINHIKNTVSEIINNYDVDGIHFDDYFYPSGGIEVGIDTVDYNNYLSSGGTLSQNDWRRENVNKMVKGVSDVVKEYNETNPKYSVAFGISPSAVWAADAEKCPDRGQAGGMNVVCGSYSSYTDLFADTKKWVEEEWLHYILPQVYYNFNEDYKNIVSWWSNVVSKVNVKLYIGTPLYRVEEFKDGLMIKKQFEYINSNPILKRNVDGFVLFTYNDLLNIDQYTAVANNQLKIYCTKGALHPVYNTSSNTITNDVSVKIYETSKNYTLFFNEVEHANGYVLYGIPKDSEIDFNRSDVAIKQAYNQVNGSFTHMETITKGTLNNFDFVLRIFDENNNPFDYISVGFDNIEQNPGPIVNIDEITKTTYQVKDKVLINLTCISEIGLPVTVKLSSSVDKGPYRSTVVLEEVSPNTYQYEFSLFKEGTFDIKIEVTDTDVVKEFFIDTINVGNVNANTDTPNDTTPNKTTSGCNFGSIVIIPLIASFSLIILKKREL